MPENVNVSRTYAAFRIWGAELNPDNIASRLKLSPSWAFRKGDKRGESKVWPHGYWEICSKGVVESTDLALHIEWLLNQLEPVKEELNSLMVNDVNADISCFWESRTGHGGPTFSPKLLARIAALNLELGLDIYFAS